MLTPNSLTPNKRLGQNFLIDPNIVRKIVALAELNTGDHVLEMGPGRGILTEALCRAAGRVTAIEVDPRLHAYLETRQSELPNVELVCEDALAYPDREPADRDSCCGQSALLYFNPVALSATRPARPVPRMVLMLQDEVADRLVANPGGSTMAYSQSWRSMQPRSPNRFVSQPSVSVPDRR